MENTLTGSGIWHFFRGDRKQSTASASTGPRMSKIAAIVPAAGKGTRTKSACRK